MDKSSQELSKIAESLGELSEQILRHQQPFESFPIQEGAFPSLYLKYLQYSDELDKNLKENYLNEILKISKLFIRRKLLKDYSGRIDENY